MAGPPTDRSGTLIESHKGYDPRTLFFHFVIALLLLVLAAGMAYQQLLKSDLYHERERQQNQRRILVPAPRGNIFDREGRLLVGNRARFAAILYLDELRKEFRREYLRVRKNYRELGDKDIPGAAQLEQIARYSVVQRYLDQVNAALGTEHKVDPKDLNKHFHSNLLLPYILLDDLAPAEYAKLLEQLPVRSPLQVYASSTRHYPYRSAASHALGYVLANDELTAENFPGEELTTFKMRGTIGREGIESEYDNLLQGETGGTIYRVDPAGYRVEPPLHRRVPVQGKNITTSLDIDLQLAAETALDKNRNDADKVLASAAVVLDIPTGEVLALASKPDFDLNDFSPRLSSEKAREIDESGAWVNRAINGAYPPGSTYKILTAIAGLRNGLIATGTTVDCDGHYMVGARSFPCHGGHAHGTIGFREAIAKSCNVFFYTYGLTTGVEALAAEGRRFRFDRPTGIELPHETKRMTVPDPAWKEKRTGEKWFPGDTANMSIGQGFVLVTPLQMACFAASVARGETFTQPTLEHHATPAPQHTEPIGLSRAQAAALREGMEACVHDPKGTANIMLRTGAFTHPVRVAGKTGTAQKRTEKGTINFAWFICYAPVEKPEIALAIMVEGDTPDEELGGGRYAAPVAGEILQKYFDKKTPRTAPAEHTIPRVQ